MKSSRKIFILSELILAAALAVVVFAMLREKSGREAERISVIIQDADASQWSAFKYGIRMAAEDFKMELSVIGTEGGMTAQEQQKLIEQEMENGADAVIVQPSEDDGTGEMLEKIREKLPVMLVESAVHTEEEGVFPCTAADNYALGEALADELLDDCSGSLQGKTLGLVADAKGSEAIRNRAKGFYERLKDGGGEISWSAVLPSEGKAEDLLQKKPKVDFIIALDDKSLVQAGKEASARNVHGALVYGIGNSTEAVYFVDAGTAECLVVPDEFNIGYQAYAEAAEKLKSRFYTMKDRTVSYTVMRRENLFSKENQEILYTMNQ